jgi:GNAT superfamily N-acetyltransferase
VATDQELLELYDAQLRAHVQARLPEGAVVERDGPLVRTIGFGKWGWVEYRDLGNPDRDELDRMIRAQIDRFAERGDPFEWKFHSHDGPPFLEERLLAAGFVAEDLETVVIAETAAVVAAPAEPPADVVIREVTERSDFDRIDRLETAVWGERSHLARMLDEERAADADAISIFVAEAGDVVVSAGWVRFPSATEFATFWGGSTLPEWRRRGIYRALVHRRARLAAERGRRFLEVDASPDSEPILRRVGFRPVTRTRPYVWKPPA